MSSGLADKGRARGGVFKVGIRPEFLKLDREAAEGGLPVRVLGVENLGNYQMAKVRLGTETVNVKAPEGTEIPTEEAFLAVSPGIVRLYADEELVV